MPNSRLYHDGNRDLQDAFDTRALADRLEQKLARVAFTDGDRSFIESVIYFFLATADGNGRPDCSFKGGPAGFVKVTGDNELAYPDYDGNGMFKSLGNTSVNPHVGLLFIDMHDRPRRLRVNGTARILRDDPMLRYFPHSQLIVRVTATTIFPNCPRYIPELTLEAPSQYTPSAGQAPVEPAWKSFDDFKDTVPCRHPVWTGEG